MPVTSGSERRIVSLAVYGDEVPGVLAAMGVAGGVIAARLEDVAEDAGPHPLPVLLSAGDQKRW